MDRTGGSGGGGNEGGDDSLIAFGNERRLHARAYDYWVSLLQGRRMPRVIDLDPARLGDFAGHAVLIDLSGEGGAPALAFLGEALRAEAGIAPGQSSLRHVPEGSLLAELLRRFPDIVAYRAPVGFEAEFVGRDGTPTLHRGMLLPLAGQGETLSAIFGVVSWKRIACVTDAPDILAAVSSALQAGQASPPVSPWKEQPGGPTSRRLDPPPLDQRLSAARTWAAIAAADRTRGRTGIHAALGATYDFLLAARATPRSQARLARSPRERRTVGVATIVGLVFGRQSTRRDRLLYAATLNHAVRLGLGPGRLAPLLDRYSGGYPAFARAERRARRAARAGPPQAARRERSADRPTPCHIELGPIGSEFLLMIGRGGGDIAARDDPTAGAAIGRFAAG